MAELSAAPLNEPTKTWKKMWNCIFWSKREKENRFKKKMHVGQHEKKNIWQPDILTAKVYYCTVLCNKHRKIEQLGMCIQKFRVDGMYVTCKGYGVFQIRSGMWLFFIKENLRSSLRIWFESLMLMQNSQSINSRLVLKPIGTPYAWCK